MELFEMGDAEKTEQEKFKQTMIKLHTVLSKAFRLIQEEYPEKFGEKINSSINENIITLTGDIDTFETESYERVIECREEKETYTIILRKE
jgi:hypothetical protein